MGGKSGQNGTRRNGELQKKIDELVDKNTQLVETVLSLEAKVGSLRKTNLMQCQLLTQEELLRIRIAELEAKLSKDETQ